LYGNELFHSLLFKVPINNFLFLFSSESKHRRRIFAVCINHSHFKSS